MSGNPEMAGGVPAAVMSRARWLRRQGVEVTVICRGTRGFDAPEVREGITLVPVRPRNYRLGKLFNRWWFHPLLPAAQRAALERRHRERPIDVIDVHDAHTAYAAAPFGRRYGVPSVMTVHGSAFVHPHLPDFFRKRSKRWEIYALLSATVVLPVSAYIRDAHRDLGVVPPERFRVVPNAVPEDAMRIGAEARPRRDGPIRLLFAARLEPEKRLDVVLRALATAGPERFRLRVLGGGTSRQDYVDLAKALYLGESVSFSDGFVKDRSLVLDALREADAFVFPTAWEAFSVALIEAMGARLCPVASDIRPNAEALGEGGLTFRLDDEAELAERLRELARDPEAIAREADRAYERAQSFLPDRCYPSTLVAYEDALSGGSGRAAR